MPEQPNIKQKTVPGALQDVEEAERERKPKDEIPISVAGELERKPDQPVKPYQFKHR